MPALAPASKPTAGEHLPPQLVSESFLNASKPNNNNNNNNIYIWSFYPTSRGRAQLWSHFFMFASAFKTGPTVDKTEGPRMLLRFMCRRYSYASSHIILISL